MQQFVVPERDPLRVITWKKYCDLVKTKPELFEVDIMDDKEMQVVILAEVEILRNMWIRRNSVQQHNFKTVGMMVYSRTERLITPLQVAKMYNKSKVAIRDRLRRSIVKYRHTSEQTDQFMLEWDLYPHIRFFRTTLVEWEKDLRKKVEQGEEVAEEEPEQEDAVDSDDEIEDDEENAPVVAENRPMNLVVERERNNVALHQQQPGFANGPQFADENNREILQERPEPRGIKREYPDESADLFQAPKRRPAEQERSQRSRQQTDHFEAHLLERPVQRGMKEEAPELNVEMFQASMRSPRDHFLESNAMRSSQQFPAYSPSADYWAHEPLSRPNQAHSSTDPRYYNPTSPTHREDHSTRPSPIQQDHVAQRQMAIQESLYRADNNARRLPARDSFRMQRHILIIMESFAEEYDPLFLL